jgi:integrase
MVEHEASSGSATLSVAFGRNVPVLRTGDGREFDKARIIPYAYRHSYAQRHADAGVAPDVLRELMDHTVLDTTRLYYNSQELHQPGEKPAGQQVTAVSE